MTGRLKSAFFPSLFFTLGVLLYVANMSDRWYFGAKDFIERREPVGQDDAEYYFNAEHFWRIPHDPRLTELTPNHQRVAAYYPLRGIGLGTLVLPFRHFWGDQWRPVYVRFVIVLNLLAIAVFSMGAAMFMGSAWFAPAIAFLFHKYGFYIDGAAAAYTECVTRAVIPMVLGLFLLVANPENRERRKAILIAVFVFLSTYLFLLKVQWWMGLFLMAMTLLLHRASRRLGAVVLIAAFVGWAAIRSINYFAFNQNKEFFMGSGLHALFYADRKSIITIGCAENLFPQSAAAVVCSSPSPQVDPGYLIEKIAPASDFALFARELTRLNMRVVLAHPVEPIKKLTRTMLFVTDFMYTAYKSPRWKSYLGIIPFWIGMLFWMAVAEPYKRMQMLGFLAFVFGGLFIPSVSTIDFDYRYSIPVRVFFYLIPMMCTLDLCYRVLQKWWANRTAAEVPR